jgi:hypothetical protein
MDPPLPTFATLSPNMDPPPPLPHVRSSSLDSIPRRRVVIYGMCALFFTTVVILFNALISFLEKLITNEAWWSYLEDTIKCHKEPCSPLARFVGINVTNTFRSCFLSSCASVSAYLVKMQHSCCTGQEVGPLSNPSLSCSGGLTVGVGLCLADPLAGWGKLANFLASPRPKFAPEKLSRL